MEQKNNNFFAILSQRKYEILSVVIFLILSFLVTFFFLWKQERTMPKKDGTVSKVTVYTDTPTNFPHSKSLAFTNIENNPEYTNVWGEENMEISDSSVKVSFPKGSFSPSNGPIKGGGGFIYSPEFLGQASHSELSYNLTFAKDFDFVKWGKLPGLCGGTCPRGGNEGEGFSTRFMWRRNGDLEVYGYLPGGLEQSIERGMFRFEPWKKYHISQEIQINTLGEDDGVIKVFVDGKCVYKNTSMVFRTTSDILPNKMIFSTFFWGADKSWATPVDTSIEFWDFTLGWE